MTPEEHREAFREGWNSAIAAALCEVLGGDVCRPADIADAIRALREPPPKDGESTGGLEMSDLVQRLRDEAGTGSGEIAWLKEAADELERLEVDAGALRFAGIATSNIARAAYLAGHDAGWRDAEERQKQYERDLAAELSSQVNAQKPTP